MRRIIIILAAALMGLSFGWMPHPGPQTWALERAEDEILYGGARGGGKTDAGLAWMIEPAYSTNPRYRGLVVRKNSDDLSDWIGRARMFYRPIGARVAGNPPVIKLRSGAFIRTGHLKDANAYEKYQGHEYHKILVEELTQIPRQTDYEKLISSARSTVPGLPAQVFCTANPGGPGHVWVKSRFVVVARLKTYIDPVSGASRIFIPAKIDDNPTLMRLDPGYVRRIEGISDEKLRNAWRWGDWDTFSGQFFDKWDNAVHVVRPFLLHPQWSLYRGLDWGYSAQAAVVWIAVDFDGNHYVYREYYKAGVEPRRFARAILGMTPERETIIGTYADPSIWAEDQYGTGDNLEQYTAKSLQQKFESEGLYCKKGNNDRLSGWNNMRDLIAWDANRKPKFFVFENCTETIRTIPGLVHDDNNVEDVDTDGEDHLGDAIRYPCMHTVEAHRQAQPPSEEELFIQRITSGDGTKWGDNL